MLLHRKVSLEPQYYLPAIPRVMARVKPRAAGDRGRLLPGIHQRPFVTSISTRGTANMVINANTATRSIIGTRGRTKMARVEMADHQRREGYKPLEARRITTVMDG